jgi:hypothetical protein
MSHALHVARGSCACCVLRPRGSALQASPGAVAICYMHVVFLRHGTSGVRFGFGFRSKQWDLQTTLLGRVGRPLVSQSKEGTTTSAAHCNEESQPDRVPFCLCPLCDICD